MTSAHGLWRASLTAALLLCCAPVARARELSEGGASDSYDNSYYSYADGGSPAPAFFYEACKWEWVGNGVCDAFCNAAERDWDGKDCFHDAPECYNEPNGADYRGTVNVTQSGRPCQVWSMNFPHEHTFSHTNYPFAGLGGHNLCRNPDKNVHSERPWCFVDSVDGPEWEYCKVPPPAKEGSNETCLPQPQPTTTLTMGTRQDRGG
jgi:hypothetical protein